MMADGDFSARVLGWFDVHGRKDLPWQQDPTPYRVWVSEIMLQQTRVSAVIDYYRRFMARFPTIETLAQAPLDDVLHQWSGLGYYARARNLHRTAQTLCAEHDCAFPCDFERIAALPGIGRSTAGAIMALSFGARYPILDGNVKRVLARYHEVEGWPGQTAVAKRLWQYAEAHTPSARVGDYTQAMMDLGATVCTRSRPRCAACPLVDDCAAYRLRRTEQLPASKPRRELPVRQVRMLLLYDETGRVLLQQRPPAGIWGGLWSLPECPASEDAHAWCAENFGLEIAQVQSWPSIRHTFTHFHLDIEPLVTQLNGTAPAVMEGGTLVWYNSAQPNRLGLPAPISRLLQALHQSEGVIA